VKAGERLPVRNYKDLVAWQKAFRLGLSVFMLTKAFPDDERFGLVSQMRRGAISVASNIAEGYGRGSRVDYLRYLKVARGALFELETQILFAKEFAYLSDDQHAELIAQTHETARLLSALISSLDRH